MAASTSERRRRGPPAGGKGPVCAVCGAGAEGAGLRPWISVSQNVSRLIAADVPDWGEGRHICRNDLARYRRRYVEKLLEDERGELTALERDVIDSMAAGGTITQNPEASISARATYGERMADRMASFGGSWTFILSFAAVLVAWMVLNVTGWLFSPFDRFPFILLNLVLSCLAAIQAPVIMMSQKRQEAKDRVRAENDYRINLKAELEIRALHEKIDHQLARQWDRLAEMQQIQIEMLEDQADKG